MPKTAKISISMPEEVLRRADRERLARGESRSELFRRALETLLREERRTAAVRRYVDGYVAQPETDYEIDGAQAASSVVWEEDWD